MARRAVIGGEPKGGWCGSHAMYGLGSLMEDNTERKICHCASPRYGSGVEAVSPKSEVFRAILVALPVVNTS